MLSSKILLLFNQSYTQTYKILMDDKRQRSGNQGNKERNCSSYRSFTLKDEIVSSIITHLRNMPHIYGILTTLLILKYRKGSTTLDQADTRFEWTQLRRKTQTYLYSVNGRLLTADLIFIWKIFKGEFTITQLTYLF